MERIDFTSYDRIIVACSGGKDSVANGPAACRFRMTI